MKKTINTLLTVIGIAIIIWFVASFIDINQHNNPMDESYKDYASWNFFTIIESED